MSKREAIAGIKNVNVNARLSYILTRGFEALGSADAQRERDEMLDAILALLSTCAVAGEPVAWRWKLRDEWAYSDLQIYEPTEQPLYAHPAPSGRDPEARPTFTVPDGFETVRDPEGRATGDDRG